MLKIDWLDWQKWIKQKYTILPYICKYPKAVSHIESWEGAWQQASSYAFVLESGKGGRYHFMGLQPRALIKGKGNNVWMTDENFVWKQMKANKPLEVVKQWMERYRAPYVKGFPTFTGGIVGYWSYDIIRSIEHLPSLARDDEQWPDYYFMMMDQLWVVDKQTGDLYCCLHVPVHHRSDLSNPEHVQWWQSQLETVKRKAKQMKDVWDHCLHNFAAMKSVQSRKEVYDNLYRQALHEINIETIPNIQIDFSKSEFEHAVKRIQEYIRAGDVFQVNLSTRQHRRLQTSGEEIYEWLRLCNPSPYMGYLRFSELELVSASPELLVKVEGDRVSTRPIAGTRRRGRNAMEDDELARELIYNEKERAEHIMLVDLERNDLGRISKFGSVHVKDFMEIEYYSHVMHIVSEVEGQLAHGKNAFDVIEAVFPGGTITGAPKIRTMEIIEQLEPVRRGPYTGSIGWMDYNGNSEFNIMIRTLVINKDGKGFVQAGAGIVIDSNPEKEYIESLNKAKALWKAIQFSELWKGAHQS